MSEDHEKRIWSFVTKYMKNTLRDTKMFLGDEALQKQQFLLNRKEIIDFFSSTLNAREVSDPRKRQELIRDYSYFQEIESMGINAEAVFDREIAERGGEEDYARWKSGKVAGV